MNGLRKRTKLKIHARTRVSVKPRNSPGTPRNIPEHPVTSPEHPHNSPEQSGTTSEHPWNIP